MIIETRSKAMKYSHYLKAGAIALLASTTSVMAGGDSVPVYTGYDQPVHVAPYTPPPTTVVTRKRETSFVIVPAVVYQDCCCCCGDMSLAMNIAAGGMIITN
jgi:hypothetical protein